MNVLQNVAYTAKATATGGREGVAKSDDGRLNVNLSTPKGLGGDDGQGTNPEQLFAAGYAACFIGALKFVQFDPDGDGGPARGDPDHHLRLAGGLG